MGKTLHLTLKKKWFDMIASGEKKEEYRDIKPYWVSRLTGLPHNWKENDSNQLINELQDKDFIYFRHYDTIQFINGYGKNAPRLEVEFKGIEVREGNEEWGAELYMPYFVLKLGNIINPRKTK